MMELDRERWKRRGFSVLKALVSCGLLYWIATRFDIGEALALLGSAHVGWILASVGLNFASVLVLSWRWKLLMGSDRANVLELTGWSLVGIGAGLFLPSSAAADGLKAVLYGRDSNHLGRSLLSTALGRILGMVAIAVHLVVGLLLWPKAWDLLSARQLTVLAGILAAASLLLVVLYPSISRWMLHKSEVESPLRSRARRGWEYLEEVRRDRVLVAKALLASIASQTLSFVGVWALFVAIDAPVGIGPLFALLPVVLLGALAPVSLGGIGVREGVMIGLFTHFGLASAQACLASSILGYGILATMGLVGAAWWLLRRSEP